MKGSLIIVGFFVLGIIVVSIGAILGAAPSAGMMALLKRGRT